MKLCKISQNTKKQVDVSKVQKAVESFFGKFKVQDLVGATKEIQDLLEIAQFNTAERLRFLIKIHDQLKARGVTLDILEEFN